MTKVQYLLKEINELDINDLELILEELLKKVDQEKRVKSILNQYKGIGKGIWKVDAQNYINKERDQDRA